MARIIDFWTPTQSMQRRMRENRWAETMRRLQDLGGMFGMEQWRPGREFKAARRGFRQLLAAPEVEDVSGVGDLNAAEAAALIAEEEAIGQQATEIEKQMQQELARSGGGGSEWTEMRRELLEGGMGAKVRARRGALSGAQMSREEAKMRRAYGLQAGGAGMAGLAAQRQAMTQWGGQQSLARMQMLQSLMPGGGYQEPNYAAYGGALFPQGGAFTKFGQGFSPATTATELRNQYIWPTQYGWQ